MASAVDERPEVVEGRIDGLVFFRGSERPALFAEPAVGFDIGAGGQVNHLTVNGHTSALPSDFNFPFCATKRIENVLFPDSISMRL